MRLDSISHRLLLAMLTVALLVPIAICVIVALGRLLAAMGDVSGAVTALDWTAAALGIVWVLDLICIVLVQAIRSLVDPHEPDGPE